jgi:hypothetical protein
MSAAQTDEKQGGSMRRGLAALVIGLLAVVPFAFATEPPAVEWTTTFTGDRTVVPNCVQQTQDGGYIVAGTTFDESVAVYLIKVNSSGSVQWENTLAGTDPHCGMSVQQTADGGYIIGGSGNLSPESLRSGAWLIKVSSVGDLEWQKVVSDSQGVDFGYSAVQVATGGYALSAIQGVSGNGPTLIRTDASGNRISQSHYYLRAPRGQCHSPAPHI